MNGGQRQWRRDEDNYKYDNLGVLETYHVNLNHYSESYGRLSRTGSLLIKQKCGQTKLTGATNFCELLLCIKLTLLLWHEIHNFIVFTLKQ